MTPSAVLPKRSAPTHFATTDKIIAIGASTGGTEAIKEVLAHLPADIPGVVIAQHIPQAFSGPFAARMNANSALSVCVASDGQPILAGHAYIAPGDRHLLVVRDGARYQCRLSDGELVNRHRPSVDVLFRSVAQSAGRNSIGVHADRHGPRRRGGHEGNARSRRGNHRAGRKHQRGLGHAGRRLANRRGAVAASVARRLPRASSPCQCALEALQRTNQAR